MKDVLVFGENLAYMFGGAERSTYLLIRQLESRQEFRVSTASCTWRHLKGTMDRYSYEGLDEIPCVRYRRLPNLRFVANHGRIARYFREASASILLANSKAGAIAVNHFDGPSLFFIHDETNLNIRRDYRTNLSSRVRNIGQRVLDFPCFAAFSHMNRQAMRKATVIANSQYMADRARDVFGIEAVVAYPQVDVLGLSSNELPPAADRPYIIMVGDSELKGADTFRKLARIMPQHQFMMVGRSLGEPVRRDNLTERGFVQDPLDIYREARVVLMPSKCEEGFGMVSVEAGALGIPAVVSRRGGLPETVPTKDCVVSDYANPREWAKRIETVLADYDRYSAAAAERARELDMRRQTDVIVDVIERATSA